MAACSVYVPVVGRAELPAGPGLAAAAAADDDDADARLEQDLVV